METIEIILMTILSIGLLLIVALFTFEYFISKLSDSNKIKKWWRRQIIDKDPYEK